MINDIVFSETIFIIELPYGVEGGDIESYSMDGDNYDLNIISSGEKSSVFIN